MHKRVYPIPEGVRSFWFLWVSGFLWFSGFSGFLGIFGIFGVWFLLRWVIRLHRRLCRRGSFFVLQFEQLRLLDPSHSLLR